MLVLRRSLAEYVERTIGQHELVRYKVTYTDDDKTLTTEIAASSPSELRLAMTSIPRQIIDVEIVGSISATVLEACCEPEEPTKF